MNPMDTEKEKSALLKIDRELAKTSSEKGLLQTFLPFLTQDSLLLPVNGFPILGRDQCKKTIPSVDMKKWEAKLTWEPLSVDISSAGDMGYTHGRLNQTVTDPSGSKKVVTTYYATFWKKDTSGKWKIALSHGLILMEISGLVPISKQFDESNLDAKNKEIVNNELAFSAYAVEHGTAEAFYRFMDDKGIAISGGQGIRKKESYAKTIAEEKEKARQNSEKSIKPVSKRTLQWEPYYSYVSSSEDMAYDYGPYTFTVTHENGKSEYHYGYFATIWKKQPDKTWKFVIDCGNQSPANTKIM